jgi:uncharacterized Fe-S center protein
VEVTGHHVQEAHIAADIHNTDGLMVLIRFKGHELADFGGALKNIGMGCAAREGKLEQHSNVSPKVKIEKSVRCGDCLIWYRGQSISLQGEDPDVKAYIDPALCTGCAECIPACPQQAIQIQWNESVPIFMEKMI